MMNELSRNSAAISNICFIDRKLISILSSNNEIHYERIGIICFYEFIIVVGGNGSGFVPGMTLELALASTLNGVSREISINSIIKKPISRRK